MMTLKFSQITKVTHALTGRRLVHRAADDDFEIYLKRQSDTCFTVTGTSNNSCS